MGNSIKASMPYLKKTFRWFGSNFGVSLNDIKEIGVEGIVTACHQIPIGEVWPHETIKNIKDEIVSHGLEWSVVESVNIHKAIKYGFPERDKYINNYIDTLHNLAANDIFIVCYNFMQLIDWTRTDLSYTLPNGAISLLYDPIAVAAFDLYILKRSEAEGIYDHEMRLKAHTYFKTLSIPERKALENAILAGMPGSKDTIPLKEFKTNLDEVSKISKRALQKNLSYFLNAVIPEAEKLGIKMAIHPDDPPFSVFGIPRIVSTHEDLQYVMNCYPSDSNGLTFCSGSLGAIAANDLEKIITDFGSQIHFIHLRNIQRLENETFYEASHLDGSIPMGKLMKQILMEQLQRHKSGKGDVAIPIRPDHGHVLLDDKNRQDEFYSGYSLIGRAKGMAELYGLEKGIREFLF
ncbi:mannonate dehydratase [Arenibacter sp. GZD96]|uniref:mannonate dehydratase n=1 Tax=Aurantibrevibacter litoralis TaxID=3106030 RepID=UPI002AFF7736|nr:mannonate dehydratase [Arenibacter sp. GZD-96]MEA1786965.1 mannonate dehydratase [Arenibacter sp. GZD-96]